MNILIAKVYHNTSSEALCILAGNTPIIIKAEGLERTQGEHTED